jgi:ATP-dependent exoDNAse (exonuclease V) beta subunit
MTLSDRDARFSALTAIDRTMLVEAGAGSGKTAILAGRIAFLLTSGVAPKHIAAITFTEFAVSELLIRIEKFVDDLTGGSVPPELAAAFPAGISEGQRRHLSAVVATLDQLTCTTIHGFAQALIRPYPAEADIDPGADIIDPAEADLAFGEKFDIWLKQHLSGECEDDIVAQLILVDETAGFAIVRLLAEFLRHNRTAHPPQGRWTGRLLRDFAVAVEAFRQQLIATDFHESTTESYLDSFAGLVGALGHRLDVEEPLNAALIGALALAHKGPCFTGSGEPRQFQLLGKWRNSAKAAGRSQADGERACAAANQRYGICHARCEVLMAAIAGELLRRLFDALGGLMASWRAHKRSAALLDFDDLLYAARDLLAGHDRICCALADHYRHVLVDELQDTDPLQIEILWRLCGEPPDHRIDDPMARRLRPGALFLVGDPKQAIYRFRGADVNAYIAARKALGPEGLCQINANFRSVKPILDFVNARFGAPLSASRGQPGFAPLNHTVEGTGEAAVVALDVTVSVEDKEVDHRRTVEAERVARLCRWLIGNRLVRDPDTEELRPCRAGDIALLAPAGTNLWVYEEALEEAGIPVSTQAGKSFFRRQEIQDLIALTRTLADARDTLALGALLRGPLIGLTETELLDIAEALPPHPDEPEIMPQLTLWTDPAEIAHPLARDVVTRLQSIALRARSTTPYLLLADAVETLSARPQSRQRHRTGGHRAVANLDLYLEMSRAYDVRGLRAFARDMRANWEDAVRQIEGRPDAAQHSVALITIHAAKGLEWPVVIPINTIGRPQNEVGILYDRRTNRFSTDRLGVPPPGHAPIQSWVAAEEDRERVRLWYVAATRTRDLLVLPRHSPELAAGSWGQVVDLRLASLPAVKPGPLPDRFSTPAEPADNFQTRDAFATEAARVVEAERKIVWRRPSRDEGDATEVPAEPPVSVGPGAAEETEEWPVPQVAGGAARGTVLHKLLEEVLTGETADDQVSLDRRATELLSQIGVEPAPDPRHGIATVELAETVLRILALPQIAALRPRLVPESPLYGRTASNGLETLVSGIADAAEVDGSGRIATVIDWKSDVAPAAALVEHYRRQIDDYRRHTGATRGLLVFMTTGRVIDT